MKKLFALVMSLCMLFVVISARAETAKKTSNENISWVFKSCNDGCEEIYEDMRLTIDYSDEEVTTFTVVIGEDTIIEGTVEALDTVNGTFELHYTLGDADTVLNAALNSDTGDMTITDGDNELVLSYPGIKSEDIATVSGNVYIWEHAGNETDDPYAGTMLLIEADENWNGHFAVFMNDGAAAEGSVLRNGETGLFELWYTSGEEEVLATGILNEETYEMTITDRDESVTFALVTE